MTMLFISSSSYSLYVSLKLLVISYLQHNFLYGLYEFDPFLVFTFNLFGIIKLFLIPHFQVHPLLKCNIHPEKCMKHKYVPGVHIYVNDTKSHFQQIFNVVF